MMIEEEYDLKIDETCRFLKDKIHSAKLLIVCGSGLGDSIIKQCQSIQVKIPYASIPHFYVSTVPGHACNLLVGEMHGVQCIIMQGRSHYYEGIEMQDLVIPVRVFAKLGIDTIILTNACGSINLGIHTGDIVLISDHIAFPCLAGITPLRGPNYNNGERFPGLTYLWTRLTGMNMKTGVYGFISGPQFETPAEVRALRLLGIDIVGMSTVPEAIAAKHAGVKNIIGLSLVTNECIDYHSNLPHEPSHEEVLFNSSVSGDLFGETVSRLIKKLIPLDGFK